MKKNQVKRNSKLLQKQSQSQKVVVNVNQPPRRRQTKRRQPSQQQQQQQQRPLVIPQVVPIPYPMMQQQQGFNQPRVAIPTTNQTFENNFKNLNEKMNNLTERFNTYGESFMNVLKSGNDKIPSDATTVKMEDVTSPPTVQLPKETPSPIVYPEGSIKINYADDEEPNVRFKQPSRTNNVAKSPPPPLQGVKDLINYKTATIKKEDETRVVSYPDPFRLFTSPKLYIDNTFSRPDLSTQDTNKIFNKPFMIEDKKPVEVKPVEVEPLQEEIVQPSVDKEETKRKGGKTCPICGEHFENFTKLSQHAIHHIDKTNTVEKGALEKRAVEKGAEEGKIKKFPYGGVTKKYEQFHPDDVESVITPLKRPYTKQTKEVVV